MSNTELTLWVDSLITFLLSYKDKRYWTIITDREKGYGIWLNQNNEFCKFQDVRKDERIPEDLKDLSVTNRHLNHDYRETLFSNLSTHHNLLETIPLTVSEIGKDIDDVIEHYEGSKQEANFRNLIFSLNKLTTSYKELRESMTYFEKMKPSLIVWSMGEGETMDLISSLVQEGDEKLKAVKKLLDNNTSDEIVEIANKMEEISQRNQKLEKENLRLQKLLDNLQEGSEINIDIIEDPISYRQKLDAQLEAQRKLIELRPDWIFPMNYGEVMDNGEPHFYSTVHGIKNEIGESIAIVLKSYKNRTVPFKINNPEWEAIFKQGAKLLVYTNVDGINDIVEISKSDIVGHQANISITFNSENLEGVNSTEKVSIFAETLRYFKGMRFDFDKFHISPNAPKIRDIHALHSGRQDETSDEDL